MHAPWRLSYLDMLGRQAKAAKTQPTKPPATQFLRDYWHATDHDTDNHIIVRTGNPDTNRGGLILLNRYPYANGHLLIALGEPRMRLLDYDEAQRAELWSLVDLAVDLCERALNPQGVNIGINQGAAAGAGIPEHLHVHVIPRWSGDVNFITTVAQVRVIPSALDDMARRYREVWEQIKPQERTGNSPPNEPRP